IGVYGSRNVCIQVSEKKYATYSFVSSMSTGFSGNLGFPLPKNWAFDQIKEYAIGSGNGSIAIDKDIKSGRDNGVTKIEKEKLSLTLQLLEMASYTYDDDLVVEKSTSPGGWILHDKYTNKFTSFDVFVYRKEISKDKYAYTVAFRGSQQWQDWVIDFLQVGSNIGGLQVGEAAKFVGKLIETDRDKMSHLYITGHSLGGYLAQWAQSEMVDENIPWVESNAVTFSAPGLTTSINFLDITHQAKVVTKLAKDKLKKYDDFIINHRIHKDLVSFIGDDLGIVHVYAQYHKEIEDTKNPLLIAQHYHGPGRFKEVELN
ncbi:glycoside hydrolase domain-containing protein, partial [Bacillus cereus]